MPHTRHSLEVQTSCFTRMSETYPAYSVEEIHPTHPTAQLIEANVKDVQDLLCSEIQEDIAGLDIQSILRFAREAGLKIEPFHIVSKDNLEASRQILEDNNVSSIYDAHGIYSPYARMSIISRDKQREALFGPMITLRVGAHEAGHSDSEYDAVEFSGTTAKEIIRSTSMPRIGNRYNPYAPAGHPRRNRDMTGQFGEEAYAEFVGSTYMMKVFPKGMHNQQNIGYYVDVEGSSVWIPAKYLSVVGSANGDLVDFMTPTLAAYTYDIFNQIDPNIAPLMAKGRSDISAYVEIDQRLDAMGVSGLAKAMDEVEYSAPAFLAGLEIASLVAENNGIHTHPVKHPAQPRPASRKNDPLLRLEDSQGVFTQLSTPVALL